MTRRHRILRKAARVTKDDLDRTFDEQLGAIKRARDAAYAAANKQYEQGLKRLKDERAEARRNADDGYGKRRDELVKRLAVEELERRAAA